MGRHDRKLSRNEGEEGGGGGGGGEVEEVGDLELETWKRMMMIIMEKTLCWFCLSQVTAEAAIMAFCV